MRAAVVADICDRLKLSASAIDELIVRSEQMAINRGWVPPVAAT